MVEVVVSGKQNGKKIKPLHGVNGGPKVHMFRFDTTPYFKEAHIPFSRLHDIEHPLGSGEFVDIHCVFPDFDADPADPKSYNFAFTDLYLQSIVDAGTEIFYRLGESIDHGPIKRYINPPKDNLKWAKICEGIIRHYNEGWADGFRFNIRYWEIWNEPENPPMWTGTEQAFFKLYEVTANHLKKCFPELKIGGYAGCGFYAVTRSGLSEFFQSFTGYFDRFLQYITNPETKAPLDFYSWHIYNADPREIVIHAEHVRRQLDKYGFAAAESSLNEWNYIDGSGERFETMRRMTGAAHVAAALCELQNAPVDSAMYYDAQPTGRYGGLFQPLKTEPAKPYFSLKAFDVLYQLGSELETACSNPDIRVCAAADGDETAAVLSNYESGAKDIHIRFESGNKGQKVTAYLLDEKHDLEPVGEYPAEGFEIKLQNNTVLLLSGKK